MYLYIKKFFDMNAPETAAPSLASLMAKSGVVNHSDVPVATPIHTTEKTDTPAPASTAPAATANAQTAETGTTESPTPTPDTSAQPQKEEPKQPSWQEVLKSQQPDAILKELGFDDKTAGFLKGKKGIDEKLLNFINHWETNNGDVTKYLQELTTDYSKMPAEEVMRIQLRQEYPKATEKQIDALFKKQVLDAYKIDPSMYPEDEVAEGRLLLEAVAEKHRDKLVQDQQQYLLPKPEQKQDGPNLEAQQAEQLFSSYKQTYSNHQAVKDLLTNKVLPIGDGDEKYNFPVSFGDEIVNELHNELAILINAGRITKDTQLPADFIENRILQYAIAKNPKAFINSLAEHFKTIGGKKVIEPLENAKPPVSADAAKAEGTPTSAAAAMAKQGRITSGGY